MTGPYDDIINLPHPEPKTHPRMSISARAAQFAPFAALTPYNDEVKEATRITHEKPELDETIKYILNERLLLLKKNLNNKPQVNITFFVPDMKKAGGAYVISTGFVKKIKEYERLIVMSDETLIPIDAIINIQGKIF
ncbi:uncharacterized protein (UPF0248 family) [Pectinatus brassicae]|uniref:Uncharacterized protein (UPF0248 family) n=1 Tax=Pectinatus brassicae TaxID=862415 RepID=A0A840UKP8_9FIRM|nr:hypothetical protein [Pectinatus brassicae]MBB5336267.1 uncharacterized protein (UPF0248 family) [Pectinatus brassicae]